MPVDPKPPKPDVEIRELVVSRAEIDELVAGLVESRGGDKAEAYVMLIMMTVHLGWEIAPGPARLRADFDTILASMVRFQAEGGSDVQVH